MTAQSEFRNTYRAARAGRAHFDMPFYAAAVELLHENTRSARVRLATRWLSRSIPALTRPGTSLIDTARWLVPARAGLYAVAAMRRIH